MSLEWWLSQACLHINSLRNQLPRSHHWSLPFQPRDPRPGRLSLTSCIIFGSHLDSYLAKGLDLIRGKEQVRCLLQVGGPKSIEHKVETTLCLETLKYMCPRWCPDTRASGWWYSLVTSSSRACPKHTSVFGADRPTGMNSHTYPRCLSRGNLENKADSLKTAAQWPLSLNLNFCGSQEGEQSWRWGNHFRFELLVYQSEGKQFWVLSSNGWSPLGARGKRNSFIVLILSFSFNFDYMTCFVTSATIKRLLY